MFQVNTGKLVQACYELCLVNDNAMKYLLGCQDPYSDYLSPGNNKAKLKKQIDRYFKAYAKKRKKFVPSYALTQMETGYREGYDGETVDLFKIRSS